MAAFYAEQCTIPLLFLNFEVSLGTLNQSLNNYGFIFDTIFSSLAELEIVWVHTSTEEACEYRLAAVDVPSRVLL